jgi:hypothetical protein
MLVCYEPPGVRAWDYRVTLEESTISGRIVARSTPYPVLGHLWRDLYAIGLSWLMPESKWPDGALEFKVTRRQIRGLLPGGDVQPYPLAPGRPLPEAMQGYYRMPATYQGVTTGPELRVLEQLGVWVAMGWRIRGL